MKFSSLFYYTHGDFLFRLNNFLNSKIIARKLFRLIVKWLENLIFESRVVGSIPTKRLKKKSQQQQIKK